MDNSQHIRSPRVEIRRSTRRRKTVSAHWSGDTVVLQVPARMTPDEVRRWECTLVARLVKDRERAANKRRLISSDHYLRDRAQRLSALYLDGAVTCTAIIWSDRQNTRWGSATPATGRIRISSRLQGAPPWVIDAVIFHELCHLVEADHGPEFRRLEQRYPDAHKAQAFLDGAAWARHGAGEQA